MTSLSGMETITLFAVLMAGFLGLMSLMLKYMTEMRRGRAELYDKDSQRATLTDDRAYFEKRLSEISARLGASEDRWKDANHLLLSGVRAGRDIAVPTIDSPFLSRFGVTARDRDIDPKLVFVLTPFSDDEYRTFKVIQDACSRIGLNAVRGDETFTPGDILSHIVSLMAKARIVIANISSRNANVYYELGIAHALDKPTILVSHSVTEMPFDVKNQRIVIFESDDDLKTKITASLARALTDVKLSSITYS